MKKRFTCNSADEILKIRQSILDQINDGMAEISSVIKNQSPVEAIRKIKFHKLINDTVFSEKLNFIEYINQTFTYLVCLYAGEIILNKFPEKSVVINFGTSSGFDVASNDDMIICECFAATTVKSNSKLKNDISRLNDNQSAIHKFIFFYSENFIKEQDYVNRLQNQYPDIKLTSLSFEQLTKI